MIQEVEAIGKETSGSSRTSLHKRTGLYHRSSDETKRRREGRALAEKFSGRGTRRSENDSNDCMNISEFIKPQNEILLIAENSEPPPSSHYIPRTDLL